MKILLAIGSIAFIVLLIVLFLGIGFGIAYGAYWLVLVAGAPKYVAVIVGIAVFLLCGISVNKK